MNYFELTLICLGVGIGETLLMWWLIHWLCNKDESVYCEICKDVELTLVNCLDGDLTFKCPHCNTLYEEKESEKKLKIVEVDTDYWADRFGGQVSPKI